jgi:hypothetical protein
LDVPTTFPKKERGRCAKTQVGSFATYLHLHLEIGKTQVWLTDELHSGDPVDHSSSMIWRVVHCLTRCRPVIVPARLDAIQAARSRSWSGSYDPVFRITKWRIQHHCFGESAREQSTFFVFICYCMVNVRSTISSRSHQGRAGSLSHSWSARFELCPRRYGPRR